MAYDFPRTKLLEWLENHVRSKVDDTLAKLVRTKIEANKMSVEKAEKQIRMGGHITIRQVVPMDRNLEVREKMRNRYVYKSYPKEFPFRCKCIVVFQNIRGVGVIMFALYVYEHSDFNPAPNNRTVYILYLDSVHYMRPRRMRTFIYHKIIIAWKRGFATAHIWACPLLKDDGYKFYSKPNGQKTPRDERLRQWCIDMLIEC